MDNAYPSPYSNVSVTSPVLDFREVTFQFPEDNSPVFKNISFSIHAGERVVLYGPSGCGKSTLLFLMNRLYPPNCDGELSGSVVLFHKDASDYSAGEINRRIATVFQDPDTQFCMPTVEQEMAFTLENLHVNREEMEQRITTILALTGLSDFRHSVIQTLSGGMKQRLATACALLIKPEVLLLDEPLAHLDPLTSQQYVEWLNALQLSTGFTVVVVEHRLDLWGSFFNRALHVKNSGVFSVEANPTRSPIQFPLRSSTVQEFVALEAQNISVNIDEKRLLSDVSLSLKKGEIAVLAGPNGSGKSTFLKTICGILKKTDGQFKSGRTVPGYVPQSPEHLFVTNHVGQEIAFSNHANVDKLSDIMHRLRLIEIQDAHPFAISHGQKRRVAIGAMIADQRPVLLLDEPTSGQDSAVLIELFHLLDTIAKEGFTLLIVTHDMAFAAAIADTVFLINNGELTGRYEIDQLWQQTELLMTHHLLPPIGAGSYV
ncbi:ABC transporter ATP-binding protein [Paenisporosarcina sp. NPDC076898]|uniref:ABC transporter ATP-binding protein n=1 Tax=unclassified Paenisporosarcina TaxID=2642018 RepID=UPI003CFFEA4C